MGELAHDAYSIHIFVWQSPNETQAISALKTALELERIANPQTCRPMGAHSSLTGTGIGFEAAAVFPEVGPIGIHGLPPPAAIGVTGHPGVIGTRELQTPLAPTQHQEGARNGVGVAVGDVHRIHRPVEGNRFKQITLTEETLPCTAGGVRAGCREQHQQAQDQDNQRSGHLFSSCGRQPQRTLAVEATTPSPLTGWCDALDALRRLDLHNGEHHQPVTRGVAGVAAKALIAPPAQGLGTLGQGLGPNMPLNFWVPIA